LANKEKLENSENEKAIEAKEEISKETIGKFENSNEEILNEETVIKNEGKFTKFLKRILSGIIDQVISIALALILLIVIKFLIGFMGYYITQKESMFLLIYIIVNVLYRPILESTKLGDTIGKKLNSK
jgi:uncharacterized RDD family membrane protein YckC